MERVAPDLRKSRLLKLLCYPVSLRLVIFFAFFLIYAIGATLLFHFWIEPTLDGRADAHIAADSTRYMYFADCLRDGCTEPLVLASLAVFPNTLWAPVSLALVLKSTTSIAVFNIGVFLFCILLLKHSFPSVKADLLMTFLLANATTLVSLLTVNKETIDLLAISLFCYSRTSGRRLPLGAALIIALVNRYEVCAMLLLFMLLQSKLNLLRKRRGLTLLALVILLTVSLPLLAMQNLMNRFEEVQRIGRDGALVLLDNLEMHFGFFAAFLPKLIEVMFGDLLSSFSRWSTYSLDDAANTYILFLNNLANVLIVAVLLWKGTFRLRNDIIYLTSVCAIVISISLVNQPRYFYICFVLLCVQAAHPKRFQEPTGGSLQKAKDIPFLSFPASQARQH
jgi:hypothetical protein